MENVTQQEKKPPVIPVISLMAAGLTVVLVLTLMPWNLFPVQVTEDVTVIAITTHGCVGESTLGISVVVPKCTSSVGDVVSATFNVPAMELNGYYDRIQTRLALMTP